MAKPYLFFGGVGIGQFSKPLNGTPGTMKGRHWNILARARKTYVL